MRFLFLPPRPSSIHFLLFPVPFFTTLLLQINPVLLFGTHGNGLFHASIGSTVKSYFCPNPWFWFTRCVIISSTIDQWRKSPPPVWCIIFVYSSLSPCRCIGLPESDQVSYTSTDTSRTCGICLSGRSFVFCQIRARYRLVLCKMNSFRFTPCHDVIEDHKCLWDGFLFRVRSTPWRTIPSLKSSCPSHGQN